MKAVLWVDTFQSLVMLLGLVCMLVVGVLEAGGLVHVFQSAAEHGRVNLLQ